MASKRQKKTTKKQVVQQAPLRRKPVIKPIPAEPESKTYSFVAWIVVTIVVAAAGGYLVLRELFS